MRRGLLRSMAGGVPPIELTDFLITVKTDNAGTSSSTQFTIPTTGPGYNYDVITSDGQYITGNTGNLTITFPIAGNYDVAIRGDFPRIYFNNQFDRSKILDVKQWGNNVWQSMASAFFGCTVLNFTATDVPNLSIVTDMSSIFQSATAFNTNISAWNVSNILNMSRAFQSTAFNQDISSWSVSNVTNMFAMFFAATAFNQNIGGWNVGNVLNMSFMFQSATAFNQDISGWNVSAVTNFQSMFRSANNFQQSLNIWNVGNALNMSLMFFLAPYNQNISGWNVSKVTNMASMFQSATAFNQDISGWNVSAVNNFQNMFRESTAFNQNIGGWNVVGATNMSFMFRGAIAFNQNIGGWNIVNVTNFTEFMSSRNATQYSAENLDSIYNGWSLLTVKPNIIIDFGTIKYTAAGQAGRDILTGAPNNWDITDGGI